MTINLIPYGQLPGGNFGINLDNITGKPIASALEVKDTLPAVGDPNNFVGRLVFAKDTTTTYVFIDTPVSFWDPLEGIPADVGAVAGNPPTVPVPPLGSLFWDTDTEVLFVWDGLQWQAAGGRYATIIVEKRYVGDNFITSYFLGTISNPLPIHVEAFLQGIRQINNSTDTVSPDYSVVGNNIVFVAPPAAGVEIFTRAMETIQIAQTAEAYDIYHTVGTPPSLTNDAVCNTAGDYCVDTGRTDIQPEATIVSIDGAVQAQAIDYTVTQADTTIASLTKGFPTALEATVTTNALHGIVIPGTVVEIRGYDVPEGDGASYVVLAVDSPLIFRITVTATEFDGTPVHNPDPIAFFTPSFITNKITFSPDPFVGGENIYIKMFKSLVTGPITGEANTLAKIPAAIGQDITGPKAGDVLQLKGIAAGTNVTVTDVGNDLVIASSTGSSYEARAGVTGNFYQPGPTISYIGVSSTPSFPVTIDLAIAFNPAYTGPGDPNSRGRRIIIKDEGGLAGVNNITIIGPIGATFENQPSHTISTNFGAVTLNFDDTNWWIVSEYP